MAGRGSEELHAERPSTGSDMLDLVSRFSGIRWELDEALISRSKLLRDFVGEGHGEATVPFSEAAVRAWVCEQTQAKPEVLLEAVQVRGH